ncbi:uncharacterized protein BXZ73DRAFT_73861 [Epithele typhae]|uniref:uncharacterized protein n=1 Tax=Epithele typhae TaxID=378194 RepID=UPI0020071F98|nr:uncharacterized protein BXZ73DRAFT_73861 [Epithele typhae]KAH9944313.1 hypothetical protein BXZ73DRAFT_73861 [Epithele typhae]
MLLAPEDIRVAELLEYNPTHPPPPALPSSTGAVQTSHLPPTDPSTYPAFIWELDHRHYTIPVESKLLLVDQCLPSLIHPAAPDVRFPAWAATAWRAMSEVWNARDVWIKGIRFCESNAPQSQRRELRRYARVNWGEVAAMNSDLLARCQRILGDTLINDDSLNDCADVWNASLERESRAVVVAHTGFVPFVTQEDASQRVLRTTLRKLGNSANGQIIIPWHIPQIRHWVTVRVDLDARTFVIVDSLRSPDDPDPRVFRGVHTLVAAIDRYLSQPEGIQPWVHDKTSIATPRQFDGVSCGPITFNTMQRMLYVDHDMWTPERALSIRMEVMDGCVKCWHMRGGLARTKTQHSFGKAGFFNPKRAPATPGSVPRPDATKVKTSVQEDVKPPPEQEDIPASSDSKAKSDSKDGHGKVQPKLELHIEDPPAATNGTAVFRPSTAASDPHRPVAKAMAALRQFPSNPAASRSPFVHGGMAALRRVSQTASGSAQTAPMAGMAAFRRITTAPNKPSSVMAGMAAFRQLAIHEDEPSTAKRHRLS